MKPPQILLLLNKGIPHSRGFRNSPLFLLLLLLFLFISIAIPFMKNKHFFEVSFSPTQFLINHLMLSFLFGLDASTIETLTVVSNLLFIIILNACLNFNFISRNSSYHSNFLLSSSFGWSNYQFDLFCQAFLNFDIHPFPLYLHFIIL